MNFDLSEDQVALQEAVLDYLADNCPRPLTLAAHEDPVRDRELWEGLMSLGIGGVNVPAELGGMGLGMLDLAVTAEAVGRLWEVVIREMGAESDFTCAIKPIEKAAGVVVGGNRQK